MRAYSYLVDTLARAGSGHQQIVLAFARRQGPSNPLAAMVIAVGSSRRCPRGAPSSA